MATRLGLCRYGIGQIYYRQEKYEMAINNFKHALNINPRSSVLMCYLGMAHHKQGRSNESLKALAEAIKLDDQNPLARYEYASVLVHLDRLKEAIAELEKLKVSSLRPYLNLAAHMCCLPELICQPWRTGCSTWRPGKPLSISRWAKSTRN